ncbi:MAG: Rieske 2Fe-2S domain-containing protein [Pirellulaceae bacterium]|nr:Rieske 2Fe-2S domain-containing protein [Pirellulaceae bacterium]
MPRFVDVAAVDAIPDGKGIAFAVDGQMIAIFNDSGTYRAIDDFCPHMGASLAEGWLEKGCVACPWHAWRFQLSDGAWLDNPKIKAKTFLVRVVAGRIEVELAD